MSADGYLLANPAAARTAALAELFDPTTFRQLAATGIGRDGRCWEVGAGGATVPEWLAARVGPGGLVVASDLDTSGLPAARAPVRVLRHDVGTEPPPATDLDLVHARLVLTHVPQRAAALASMVAAVRPGGWVVVEDADPGLQPLLCPDESGPAQERANRLRRGFRSLMAGRQADLAFGRTLPRLLRDQGLVDVVAEAWFPITAPACAVLERATVEQIRDRLVDARLATDAEIDQHLRAVASGEVADLATAPLVSVRGRVSPAGRNPG